MLQESEYTRQAMGTDCSVAIVCELKEKADIQAEIAFEAITKYENIFSRFKKESELSLINNNAQNVVSDIFLEVIQEAYALFTKTQGVFNPLVQIERFGYDTHFDLLTGKKVPENNKLYNVDFSSTVIDVEHNQITLQEGQKLDVGGFLKGYLATKLIAIAEALRSQSAWSWRN